MAKIVIKNENIVPYNVFLAYTTKMDSVDILRDKLHTATQIAHRNDKSMDLKYYGYITFRVGNIICICSLQSISLP